MSEAGGEALVLVGHGSHLNPRSSEPVHRHAERLREQEVFTEVREAFWKEEPALREVLRTVRSDRVFVVPVFMSEGYFVEEVVPRELRLPEEFDLDVEKHVCLTEPVGTHPGMTDVVVEYAGNVYGGDGRPGLAVVGHGTERNPRSAEAVRRHVDRIRERGEFREVEALFMDEDPLVEDLTEHFDSREVVVVPFFAADGLHTREDIPRDIGLDGDGVADGHRVWYSGAVGLDPCVADVVLERAWDTGASGGRDVGLAAHERAFLNLVDREGKIEWGELIVTLESDGYGLRHSEDEDECGLEGRGVGDVNRIARYADEGGYRPLKGERSLPTGWVMRGLDREELLRAVRSFYPAAVANWYREREGRLDVTSWCETAERMTGIYSDVGELSGADLDAAVDAVCGNCVRGNEWHGAGGEGDIPCREACSFFVAAAREFLEAEGEPGNPSIDVRRGEFSERGNLYRERYLRRREREVEV